MNIYVYVLIAAVFFVLLNPGFIVTLPPSKGCNAFFRLFSSKDGAGPSCATSIAAVLTHALVFIILFGGFVMWRKRAGNTPIYIYPLVAALLYIALTPGMLLTLPPSCQKGVFVQMSKQSGGGCATSYAAVFVHALIYLIVFGAFIMWRKKADGIY